MEYGSLVSGTEAVRKTGADLLVIISSYNSPELVLRHLALLEKQTFREFDVLLVAGEPFDASALKGKKSGFGLVIARENAKRGCAGAFFTGQKYALENGYKYVIMADDDCMPTDRRLVEELYRNRSHGYVAPTTVFVEGSYRKKGFRAGPTQYSLYSREIFLKYGLYFLPLYNGADDGEYMERVKIEPLWIKNETEHPYISGMRLYSSFDRSLLFLHQALVIIRNPAVLAYNLAQHSFFACAALFFLPPYGRSAYARMKPLLLTYTYGKKASEQLQTGYRSFIEKRSGESFAGFAVIDEKDASYIDGGTKGKLLALAGAAAFFRKRVVIEKSNSFLRGFALAAFARQLYVKAGDGGYLLMADNGSLPAHIAKLALFAVFLPLDFAVTALLFVPIKALKQPATMRYGL